LAAVLALVALSLTLHRTDSKLSPEVACVLGAYVAAYVVRIHLMNRYKAGPAHEDLGYYGAERLTVSASFAIVRLALLIVPCIAPGYAAEVWGSLVSPPPRAGAAAFAGIFQVGVAVFSVLVFLLPARTATFVGVVSRVSSLAAALGATLVLALAFGGKP